MKIKHGRAFANQEPGIGIDWDMEALSSACVKDLSARAQQAIVMQRMGSVIAMTGAKINENKLLHADA